MHFEENLENFGGAPTDALRGKKSKTSETPNRCTWRKKTNGNFGEPNRCTWRKKINGNFGEPQPMQEENENFGEPQRTEARGKLMKALESWVNEMSSAASWER